MMIQDIRIQLEHLSEAGYKAFNEKLLPGVPNILGVRLPELRGIAKQIAKKDADGYFAQVRADGWPPNAYYEEKMIYGLVIGYAKMDDMGYKEQLDAFVPLIDNWGVCDSCCMTYKWMRKNQPFWWNYLNGWIAKGTQFPVRFGLVCILGHFVDTVYIQKALGVCGSLQCEGYYAKMAAAWLVSACFAKFPQETYTFLQSSQLDTFTHNKAIQKTCESFRVSKEWKGMVRQLKRIEL